MLIQRQSYRYRRRVPGTCTYIIINGEKHIRRQVYTIYYTIQALKILLSLLRVSIALKPKRAKPYKKLQYIQQILLYQINEIKDLWSQGLSNNIVATKIGISRRAVDKLRLNIDLFNQLYLSFVKKGPIRKLSKEQEDFVLDYLYDRPTVYRSEI